MLLAWWKNTCRSPRRCVLDAELGERGDLRFAELGLAGGGDGEVGGGLCGDRALLGGDFGAAHAALLSFVVMLSGGSVLVMGG